MGSTTRTDPGHSPAPSPPSSSEEAAMKLETYQDNGGRYHWHLAATDGTPVAASVDTYTSREEARHAAQEVHDQAAAITIEAG